LSSGRIGRQRPYKRGDWCRCRLDEFWESGEWVRKSQGSGKKAHIGREWVKRAWAVARGPTKIRAYNPLLYHNPQCFVNRFLKIKKGLFILF
jgi:hypothetical protein